MDSSLKPISINEVNCSTYLAWHSKIANEQFNQTHENWYNQTVAKILDYQNQSGFQKTINASLQNWADEYLAATGYPLLTSPTLKLVSKPYSSIKEKYFRINRECFEKNTVPKIRLPDIFTGINDIVRGTILVKYLDGVEFLLKKLINDANELSLNPKSKFEARDQGYFAAHFYYLQEIPIFMQDWEERRVKVKIEIQIATQLQDVIRQLTHKYYEKSRLLKCEKSEKPWQWEFESVEFFSNSMGHIMHSLEGMILEIRNNKLKG